MSSSSWLERHDALKAQAEDLANSARREAESAASASGQGRGGMQSLAARRKLMEMSRVIASMEKLSQDNLCASQPCLRSALPSCSLTSGPYSRVHPCHTLPPSCQSDDRPAPRAGLLPRHCHDRPLSCVQAVGRRAAPCTCPVRPLRAAAHAAAGYARSALAGRGGAAGGQPPGARGGDGGNAPAHRRGAGFTTAALRASGPDSRDALPSRAASTAGALPCSYGPTRQGATNQCRLFVQELLQEQYAGLARQDEQLDRVAASVGRVHTQAEAVHGEVHEQVRVIDSLHRGTDGVTDRVASVRGRVEGVLARMNRKLFYAVCFAVPFCVMLALGLLIRYA